MAISVGRTMKELQDMAKEMNIQISERKDGKRLKKEDYIYPIRNHILIERYKSLDNIPNHLKWVLSLKSPMLAARIDKFKEDERNEVWKDPNWDMEQKLNGVRCFIVKDSTGIHLYSRHNSVVDLLPITFTDNVLFPPDFNMDILNHDFILDTEMTSDNPNISTVVYDSLGVETESQLQAVTSILGSLSDKAIEIQKKNNLLFTFNAFDCIFYDDKWIMNEPLSFRRSVLKEAIKLLQKANFKVKEVPHTNVNKEQFFKSFIDRGLEGTVAKRLDGIYIPDTTRNFKGWIKCKRSMSMALNEYTNNGMNTNIDDALAGVNFGDTVDAFITGFEQGNKGTAFENLIGSISVSVYVLKKDGSLEKREIGKISGISLDLRKQMTEIIDGEPVLKAEYYNKVVEIDGQNITKNGKFQHCILVGFRYDKLADACVLSEDFLDSQLL